MHKSSCISGFAAVLALFWPVYFVKAAQSTVFQTPTVNLSRINVNQLFEAGDAQAVGYTKNEVHLLSLVSALTATVEELQARLESLEEATMDIAPGKRINPHLQKCFAIW